MAFCVVDAGVAFQLRPDLWATRMNCGADLATDSNVLRKVAERRGAKLLPVSLPGMDRRVPLLAMSEHMVGERIEWLTGRRATGICALGDPEVAPAPTPVQAASMEDEPPRHQCEARRQWFEARGLKDPLAVNSKANRPPTTGYRAS